MTDIPQLFAKKTCISSDKYHQSFLNSKITNLCVKVKRSEVVIFHIKSEQSHKFSIIVSGHAHEIKKIILKSMISRNYDKNLTSNFISVTIIQTITLPLKLTKASLL